MNKPGPLFFWTVSLLLLMLLAFWSDDPIRSFIKERAGPQDQRMMLRITRLGEGIWLFILSLAVWVSGYFFKFPRLAQAARYSCYSLAVVAIAVQILKRSIGRPRPWLSDQGIVHLGPALANSYDSFPSGHAVSIFAVATVFSKFFPRVRWVFYGMAALIAASRVYIDWHYASDVIGGAVLGITIGMGMVRIQPVIHTVEAKLTEPVQKSFSWTSAWAVLGLAALSALLFFYQLGNFTLTDVDEGVYAAATQEMVETGDLITPHYNGANRYDKPILFYWLITAAYTLFGVNEFAARFWSALFGVGLVLMTFLFANRYGGIKLGWTSALILATSLETVALAHAAITDMTLIFFMTGALYSFYLGADSRDAVQSRSWYLTSGACMALAVLTKGPVAVVIPAMIIVTFLIAARKWKSVITWNRLIGVGTVFLLIAGPWYFLQFYINGWEFVDAFVLKHNIGRYTGVISGHKGPWYYYLIVLLAGFFPWVSFLPAAIWAQVPRRSAAPPLQEPLGFFLLIWFVIVFLFFTAAQTKLPNYIGPLFPPASILVALWLVRNFSDQRDLDRSAWFSIGLWVMITMGLAIALLAVPVLIEKAQQRYSSLPYLTGTIDIGQGPRLLALELLIGAMLGLWMMIRRPFVSVLFLAGMMLLFHLTLIHQVLPVVDRYVQRPLKDLALRAGRELKTGDLIVYGMNKPSVLFYAKRYAWNVFHPDKASDFRLQKLLESPERHFVITRVNLLPRLKVMPRFFIVDQRGGYLLASNQPAQ